MVSGWIKDEEALSENHYVALDIINSGPDSFFPVEMECLSKGCGFGNDMGSCFFRDELDKEEQAEVPLDGVRFSYDFSEKSVILSKEEMFYYMTVACKAYCSKYPHTKARLEGYLKEFAKLTGLG